MKQRVISSVNDTTDNLHHIGLINSSLEKSSACYERLGFTLTPLSIPRIIIKPGGTPESIGAGNRHAIFTNNYLELLGIVDPEHWASVSRQDRGPYDLDAPLGRYEGLHVMHFGTTHIEQVKERFDRQGITSSAIREFQRNVKTDTGEQMMRARTISFPPDRNQEGLLQVAQHDTPELVFQDRYRHHRNGAIALTEIMIVSEMPDSYAVKYEHYTGHESRRIANNHFVVDLGFSSIIIVNPECLHQIIPGYRIPVLPFMAAFTIKTSDLQLTCEVLSENKVPFIKNPDSVRVDAGNACGCAVIFKE